MSLKSTIANLAYGRNFTLPHRTMLDMGVLGEQEVTVLYERHNKEDTCAGTIEVKSVSWKGTVITSELSYEVLDEIGSEIAEKFE